MNLKKNGSILLTLFLFQLSACNLYGGIDKPSGDAQLLSAARTCLDQGDYPCARQRYQALSTSSADYQLSELALTTLAENQIFSISDLITTLGTSRGGGTSLSLLAQTMASRGKIDGATRTSIQASYASVAAIQSSDLRAFMQFLTAYAMTNEILANAVAADGQIHIVQDATACKLVSVSNLTCIGSAACAAPSGTIATTLLDSTTSEIVNTSGHRLSDATNWSTPPTLIKFIAAASDAATAISTLNPGSYSGIFKAINDLNTILAQPGVTSHPECIRAAIVQQLL